MALRFALALLTVVATAGAARACPASAHPCMKYKGMMLVAPQGYVHSIRGDIPKWSDARITKFLSSGSWQPVYDRHKAYPNRALLPQPVSFVTADKAVDYDSTNRMVIVRRLEKQPGGLLVEIDGAPWKLQRCAARTSTACLVPTETLTFTAVE